MVKFTFNHWIVKAIMWRPIILKFQPWTIVISSIHSIDGAQRVYGCGSSVNLGRSFDQRHPTAATPAAATTIIDQLPHLFTSVCNKNINLPFITNFVVFSLNIFKQRRSCLAHVILRWWYWNEVNTSHTKSTCYDSAHRPIADYLSFG